MTVTAANLGTSAADISTHHPAQDDKHLHKQDRTMATPQNDSPSKKRKLPPAGSPELHDGPHAASLATLEKNLRSIGNDRSTKQLGNLMKALQDGIKENQQLTLSILRPLESLASQLAKSSAASTTATLPSQGTPATTPTSAAIAAAPTARPVAAPLHTLEDMSLLAPRGKFSVDLCENSFLLRGKKDVCHQINYNDVAFTFVIEKCFDLKKQMLAVCRLSKGLVVGKTTHHVIILQFPSDHKLLKHFSMNTPDGVKTYAGADGLCSAIGYLSNYSAMPLPVDRAIFKTSKSLPAVRCHLKVTEGLLYPLKHGLFFLSPGMYVEHREIKGVELLRVGSSSTFDFHVMLKNGTLHEFNMIDQSESEEFVRYCNARRLRTGAGGDSESDQSSDDSDEDKTDSDDDEFNPNNADNDSESESEDGGNEDDDDDDDDDDASMAESIDEEHPVTPPPPEELEDDEMVTRSKRKT